MPQVQSSQLPSQDGSTGRTPLADPVEAMGAVPAPYFDPHRLRAELSSLLATHGGVAMTARPAVLDRLKRLVVDARDAARQQLGMDGNGRRCAEGLARFQDELIHLVFDYAVAHVYRATNPSEAQRMAIAATGGYGRGLLAPGSDIDLLFLLPYKQTHWGESVVEYLLYLLWDLGFNVGHATRTVGQCLKFSAADMTIRTALLDSRLILGDATLFDTMTLRFRHEVVAGSARAFIEAKLSERDERHQRAGESRYRVEPNIKDGKGGLRDLHTLHWLAKYLYGENPSSGAVESGIFTAAEYRTYRKCEDFLWTVRCHLHFMTGRTEERLTFDMQPLMAERLGYVDRSGLRAVERFMKHYFLVAKDVGDLTTILCSALEMHQFKASPGLTTLFNRLSWRTRRRIQRTTEFRVVNGRLNVADNKVFERDPVNLIRFFARAEEIQAFFHPEAVRLLRASLRLIDGRLRQDKEANRIFLQLLTAETNPEATLRRMNEAGVLGRFIPDFGKVVSMMQFNMYHHFTVDEHLIRTVGALFEIEDGTAADELPLSSRIIKGIQHRRALYVAAFLHDIGKGRGENHSLIGADIARHLCPRFGLTPAETETVAWLIEHHLTMSNIAQSRDLGDPKTIRDFASIVQSPERLKLLLLLTVADIRAVGPGTWNGWKGQLLRTLYHEAMPLVSGGHTQLGFKDRVPTAQDRFRVAAAHLPRGEVERFIERHYPDYWLKTDTTKQLEHAALLRKAEAQGLKLATDFRSDNFTAVTELSVLAPNHPRLLALFAGACAAAGANIVGAHISTTRDGLALDTFLLQREFEHEEDERRRAKRIGETIEQLLQGRVRLSMMMAKKFQPRARQSAFKVEPEVVIDNALSDQFTVIEVAGLDRPGLLYELTNTLSDLNLDITSAHITTFGEKAVDVFYVTDLTNKKIANTQRQRTIRDRMLQVLAPDASTTNSLDSGPAQ
jgi:[protein-PII] uridylyltransferase